MSVDWEQKAKRRVPARLDLSTAYGQQKLLFGLNEDVVRFEWRAKGWVGAGQG